MRILRVMVAGLALVLAVASGATTSAPLVSGDAPLVARLQREGRVETAVPRPSLAEWGRSVGEAMSHWVWNHLPGPRWLRSGGFWKGLGWVTLGLAVMVLALAMWRLVEVVRRKRHATAKESVDEASGVPAVSRRPAGVWWEACEEQLAAGRPRAALTALWWWLAESLAGSSVQPSWTSRQLVGRSGRPDLRAVVGRLDSLLYGRGGVDVDRVRALAGELAERVP